MTQGDRGLGTFSEGQFNTVVYEDDDLYRGQDRRDVILLHPLRLLRTSSAIKRKITPDLISPSGYWQSGFQLHWHRAGAVWAMDFNQPRYPIDGVYDYLFAAGRLGQRAAVGLAIGRL